MVLHAQVCGRVGRRRELIFKGPWGNPRARRFSGGPARRATIDEIVSQVFLSYRHVPPDEQLAEGLSAFLQERGLRVFLDKQIRVGLDWVAEIDRQLRASDSFVVLLSEDSIRSDMVRQEVQTAHELRQAGKLAIFPVRLGFRWEVALRPGLVPEPHPVHPLASRRSGGGAVRSPLCGDHRWRLSPGDSVFRPSRGRLPRRSLGGGRVEGGPPPRGRSPDRHGYGNDPLRLAVLRPAQGRTRAAESCLARPGSTIVVKGPRQSGKSSLLARIHALSKRGAPLGLPGFSDLRSSPARQPGHRPPDARPADRSRAQDHPAAGRRMGFRPPREKGSFAEFLARAVLDGSSSPVVLILDEVDRLFDRPYRGEFFAAVRGGTTTGRRKRSGKISTSSLAMPPTRRSGSRT